MNPHEMTVDGVVFPASAIEYLRRHKPAGKMILPLCERQVQRARKQLEDLGEIGNPISVLDIGCGLAVVDVLLVQRGNVDRVHLMDGDGTAERHGEYREVSVAWNNVETGADMVRANAREKRCHVVTHRPGTGFDIPVDLVMSLKSWGLHYPVHTYLEMVRGCLRIGGLLVIDIHREAEGCAEIEAAGFRLLRTIGEYGEVDARTIIPFTRHIFQRGKNG